MVGLMIPARNLSADLNFPSSARNLWWTTQPTTSRSEGMASTPEQLYERVLVVRCQAGDESAFEELVVRYAPRLRYYLRKMLGDGGGPEDAAQDVWIAVFRGLPRLTDAGAFPAWLYRIARDRAYRQMRRSARAYRPLQEADLAEDGFADEEVLSAEDAEAIHVALDTLAPEHREVLVLRFVEDMNYEAIAEVTGCPLGTVRSRLYYAKRALRQALERMNTHGG
jgi:RNA polymerase sigma-70 factor (ECF subfamily)